ncbi:MAG: N-acetylmuramoyl-L-alanine amidase [Ramlibacter sp.]
MASAADSALVQGYCGPLPPNSWFQFSSSTVPAVQAQLLSTLTARAFSIYDVAVPKYVADYITPAGCTAQVTPRPGTYCTSPLDCTAQIDGEIRVTCGGQSSTPFLNTFAIERGGCWAEPAPNSAPKKVVVLDPGHGFTCTAKRMPGGAIGITDFPPNDPPAGRLREDDLTMAIASEVRRILPTSMYRVELTKANANECPSYRERARIANKEEAKAFVSIHINAPLVVPGINVPIPAAHGTSVLYNVNKSGAFNLAYAMAGAVSSSLGVNNRGAMVNDDLAVLKENYTETGIAVLLEAARLSGDDERKLHASGSATRIANGIKAALDASLGN